MFVAIIHYHLRPCGVTRIIEQTVSALTKDNNHVVVFTGEPTEPDSALFKYARLIDGLSYEQRSFCPHSADLVSRLLKEAKACFGRYPDIWHFHNHSLGKNCALSCAVRLLALKGQKILLQIHDFAEDLRPELFRNLLEKIGNGKVSALSNWLYPQAAHIHYATINMRDYSLLAQAGVTGSRIHFLPNPVTYNVSRAKPVEKKVFYKEKLFLYCTRAIRRKNIGEFLLWSSVGAPEERYAITRAPKNPAQRPIYDNWLSFAKDCKLNVEFEFGSRSKLDLTQLLHSAYATVTTSIAEGFGMEFLEPWLFMRPVLGRKLPEITGDFEDNGLNLSSMYSRLLLPLKWIDKQLLFKKICTAYKSLSSAYNRAFHVQNAEKALAAAIEPSSIDFGRLDEELQQRIIRKVAGSSIMRKELNPKTLFEKADISRVLEYNREQVRCNYALEDYSKKLSDAYAAVANSEVESVESGFDINVLLDAFLAPERFYLLRS